jgi:hypothetical protein
MFRFLLLRFGALKEFPFRIGLVVDFESIGEVEGPYWMKASSSLLEAFVGGVFAFSDPSPRIASQEPAKVTPNVAMASCESSLDDDIVIGRGVRT